MPVRTALEMLKATMVGAGYHDKIRRLHKVFFSKPCGITEDGLQLMAKSGDPKSVAKDYTKSHDRQMGRTQKQTSWRSGNRFNQSFTHFLSIPFTNDDIQQSFLKFKDKILGDADKYGIHEAFFQKPEKLHITLTMLVLLDESEHQAAVERLEECKEAIIDPILLSQPLKVEMMGLDSFSKNLANCHVLFGKVHSPHMQEIADKIMNYFVLQGFAQLEWGTSVKLHVTLLNSSFKQREEEPKDDNKRWRKRTKRQSFDATKVVEDFKNFHFGSFEVDEIHVSQLSSVKAPNGYYASEGVIKL